MGEWTPLRWTAGRRRARLDAMCGWSEIAARDTSPSSAIACLDALLPTSGEADELVASEAATLSVADRDRLLAHLYLRQYGAQVETTLTCAACAQPFDLDFLLADMVQHCEQPDDHEGTAPETLADDATGRGRLVWTVGDLRFGPVTGIDELAVAGLRVDQRADHLLARVIEGDPSRADRSTVSGLLEQRCPLLSTAIGATCPECDEEQAVTFDVQTYVLRKLELGRTQLFRDVHLLASTYHWTRDAILSLTSAERRSYVDHNTADRTPSRAGVR